MLYSVIKNNNVSYRFVLGVEDLEEKDRDKIKEEAELHNDIIYFGGNS